MNNIQSGFCQCGCGASTSIMPFNDVSQGMAKGQHYRYVAGHNGRIKRRGYIRKRVNGESMQEHVIVAERALGKPLPDNAEVHHVDNNKRNNANSNLVICQDSAYHALLHIRARVVRAGGDPNTQRLCCDCGLRPRHAFNRRVWKGVVTVQSACRVCQAKRYKQWCSGENARLVRR